MDQKLEKLEKLFQEKIERLEKSIQVAQPKDQSQDLEQKFQIPEG